MLKHYNNIDYIVSDVDTIADKILIMKDSNPVADDSPQEFG